MATETLKRCKCGEPMPNGVTCDHCDRATPGCTLTEKHGECETKPHNPKLCPRCTKMMAWVPLPGQFDDLPHGYKDNTKRGL